MRGKAGDAITPVELETLRSRTFYGREKDNAVYPIALANLVLHGIDEPHIWHGNALSGIATYDGLFAGAPQFFDYVLTAIPVGGREGPEAQTPHPYKTPSTAMLFLQHVMGCMKTGATCGFVLDEGALFRINELAFVQIKRKLLEEFNVWCIISLPAGTYASHTKDNILFFTKGEPTDSIWYFDLSDIKVGKKTPLTKAHFDELFQLLPTRGDSERSWTVPFAERLQQALKEASPFREMASQRFTEAKSLEDNLKEKRKAKSTSPEALTALEEQWKGVLREARENESKAQTIEDAVYDLKAVNPNKADDSDKRTPTQLLEVIETKGRDADAALTRLRSLISEPQSV